MIGASSPARPLASADQWRDALIRVLISAPDDRTAPAAFLGQFEHAGATVTMATSGQLVALVIWPEQELAPYEHMRRWLTSAVQTPRPNLTHMVLIGGGEEAWRLCEELKPSLSMRGKFSFHALDLGGELRSAGMTLKPLEQAVQSVRERLERGEAMPYLSDDELQRARARFSQVQQAEAATLQQLNQRQSPATVALIAAIVLMFGLQWYWGDVKGLNAAWQRAGAPAGFLFDMGALWRAAVLKGQWWRLVSCMFLHGGIAHIGANAWSLWALGRFVEKVLGPSRYIILYTLSGIAGSIASAALGHFSIGASGAIFGLVGGLMALTYMRQVLPPTISLRLRRAMWPVLILNLGISMMPGIDASAHFGGALVGFVLAASGILTMGMPSLMSLAHGQRPPRSWPVIGVATICVLLMAGSVALALLTGRPWEGPT